MEERTIRLWRGQDEPITLFEARDDIDDVSIDSLAWNADGNKLAARVSYGDQPSDRVDIVAIDVQSNQTRSWECACNSVQWVQDSLWTVSNDTLRTFTVQSSGPTEVDLTLDQSSMTESIEELGFSVPLVNPMLYPNDESSVMVESSTAGSGYIQEPVFSMIDRSGVVYPFRTIPVDDANSGLNHTAWDKERQLLASNVGWRNGDCQETQSGHLLASDGSTDRLAPPGEEGWTVYDLTIGDDTVVASWGQERLMELGRCEVVEPDIYSWDGQRWRRSDLPRGSSRVRIAADGTAALERKGGGVDGEATLEVVEPGQEAQLVSRSPGEFEWSS